MAQGTKKEKGKLGEIRLWKENTSNRNIPIVMFIGAFNYLHSQNQNSRFKI